MPWPVGERERRTDPPVMEARIGEARRWPASMRAVERFTLDCRWHAASPSSAGRRENAWHGFWAPRPPCPSTVSFYRRADAGESPIRPGHCRRLNFPSYTKRILLLTGFAMVHSNNCGLDLTCMHN